VTSAEPSPALVREWAAYGIGAAAARFVPVPFVDDLVKRQATRLAVVRTLTAHGRTYPPDAVEPLFDPEGFRSHRIMRAVTSVPRRVLLFPVRKYAAILGAVRGVPNDVLTVVLLGRAVHRFLAQGRLAGPDQAALREEAAVLRRAFDDAAGGADLPLLGGALRDGLAEGRQLSRAAVEHARRTFARGQARRGEADSAAIIEADIEADIEVQAGAARVEETLRRPEIATQLARFDARLDALLDARTASHGSTTV